MYQTAKDILKIKNNVFTLTPVLLSFYEGCETEKDNLFLSFLLFPILFNNNWMIKRQSIRVDSTLEGWKEENKLQLEGFPSRVEYFKDITLKCLQYAVDMDWIIINRCVVKLNDGKKTEWNKEMFYKDQMSNARNINKLMMGKSVGQIYSILDIKEIWKQS